MSPPSFDLSFVTRLARLPVRSALVLLIQTEGNYYGLAQFTLADHELCMHVLNEVVQVFFQFAAPTIRNIINNVSSKLKFCRRSFGTRNIKATFFRYAEHQCEKIEATLLRGAPSREDLADALETNIEAAKNNGCI